MSIIRFLIVLFILICNVFSGLASDLKNEWKYIGKRPFIVFYQNNDLKNAEYVLNILHDSYEHLTTEIGGSITDSISIFISATDKQYYQMVGRGIPKWSEGIASPSDNVIIIKAFHLLSQQIEIRAVIVHELVHIILDRALAGNPIPRWMNEGIAVYYSGEKRYASTTLISKALLTKSIIDLFEIDNVLRFHREKAQLAYQESFLAIEYFINEYGTEALKSIISKVADGVDTDKAFEQVISVDTIDFEIEWLNYIKKKYRWHFLVEFDNYLWIFILILFIIGVLIIRKRNKRTIENWNEEEDIFEQ